MSILTRDERLLGFRRRIIRFWNRLSYTRFNPTPVIAVVLTIFLIYLVLAPIGALVTEGAQVQFRDAKQIGKEVGDFTTYYFERTLFSKISTVFFWKPLSRTLTIGVGVLFLALLLGSSLAWLVVRTDLPGRKWLASALVIPYILPSWTFAMAWLTLFKNRRIGGVAGIAETLGFLPPDWLAYGPVPIIICLGLHYFPFAFLLFGSALRSMDAMLEESARILGASRLITLRRIVLPLMRPALMSAVLLTFSRTLGTFGTPYILGRPINYTVLSTSLYGSIKSANTGVAAVLTFVIVLLGISMVGLDMYFVRESSRFVTISGKGGSQQPTALRKARLPLSLFAFAIVAISIFVPLIVLLLSTLTRVPGVFTAETLTTKFWLAESLDVNLGQAGAFKNDLILDAAWNSIRIASAAAIISGILGFLIGYVVVKVPHSWGARFLRQASFLPYLVPSIGFGAAYLSLFAMPRGPIPALYGTLLLVAITMGVKYLPLPSRAGISAMMQLGNEPEEAATICGAPWLSRLLRIVVPIQKSALITGVLLPFISGMKELSLIIMLAAPGIDLLTTQVLRFIDYNYVQLANATLLIIILIIFILTYIAQRLTGSSLASGFEG
ncbi:MAG: ABC transporter permease subunit [Anaerolineales bacterium]|nr:ABC transporter permease subunit [Anaerolineales bacterium]